MGKDVLHGHSFKDIFGRNAEIYGSGDKSLLSDGNCLRDTRKDLKSSNERGSRKVFMMGGEFFMRPSFK